MPGPSRERICGVCTTVHALACVRAVENALDIQVPPNAELIRNIMFLTQMVQDHVIHFYHLHALDWVDVVIGAQSRPGRHRGAGAEGLAVLADSSPGYFSDSGHGQEIRGIRPARHLRRTPTGAIPPTNCRRKPT